MSKDLLRILILKAYLLLTLLMQALVKQRFKSLWSLPLLLLQVLLHLLLAAPLLLLQRRKHPLLLLLSLPSLSLRFLNLPLTIALALLLSLLAADLRRRTALLLKLTALQ